MMEQEISCYLNSLCMIPSSMGIWEKYFKQLGTAWGDMNTEINPIHIIFAADNGIVSEGHIGFGGEITRLHGLNMVRGGAAATALCKYINVPYEVVDAGVISDVPISFSIKAAKGTKNFLRKPAMTEKEFKTVWNGTVALIEKKAKEGINLFSFGEMGIGNTTTSAAVLSALANLSPNITVGRGSGADDETLKKKMDIVRKALQKYKDQLTTPESIIQHIGGFDIVAITAAMVTCTRLGIPYIIDGYIACVSHACAYTINPEAVKYGLPSHMSREKGMNAALKYAELDRDFVPIHAHMALGEGTGAIMMIQLLKMTQFMFLNMVSLESIFQEPEKAE